MRIGASLLIALSLLGVAAQGALAAEVKTSKERLSDKAADEQRVDNCRVPVERRGPVPRPSCADELLPPTAGSRQDRTQASQPR
jgi:hypothetical protein